jgi:hypothetical protein
MRCFSTVPLFQRFKVKCKKRQIIYSKIKARPAIKCEMSTFTRYYGIITLFIELNECGGHKSEAKNNNSRPW